jgi:uncharacterized integral membrane protein
MLVFPIIAAVLAGFTIVFIVQNITPATVHFLLWQFQGSLALTLFVTAAIGAIIALLALVPTFARRRSQAVEHMRREAQLQGALDEHRRRLDEDRSRLEVERHRLEEERRRAESMQQVPASKQESKENTKEQENQPTPS